MPAWIPLASWAIVLIGALRYRKAVLLLIEHHWVTWSRASSGRGPRQPTRWETYVEMLDLGVSAQDEVATVEVIRRIDATLWAPRVLDHVGFALLFTFLWLVL